MTAMSTVTTAMDDGFDICLEFFMPILDVINIQCWAVASPQVAMLLT